MTKKHFQALADALRSSRPAPDGHYDEVSRTQWDDDVQSIADACARFNPNFDRARFITATEE